MKLLNLIKTKNLKTLDTQSSLCRSNGILKTNFYKNVSTLDKKSFPNLKLLTQKIQKHDLEVDPKTNYVYLKKSKYIQILDSVFGSDWKLQCFSNLHVSYSGKVMYSNFGLYVKDTFISEAFGESELKSNSDEDIQNAIKEVEYVALVRCCKDLLIASELWDPANKSNWKNVAKKFKN